MTLHRFYAPRENFDGSAVALDSGESRHLKNVLRLREGDDVLVFDGGGHEYRCRVDSISGLARLSTLEEVAPSAPESPLTLTVAAAIVKGEKFDLVIQKMVELGVKRFVPLVTKRCETGVSVRAAKSDRWQKIAFEAAKQCGRAALMTIDPAISFDDLLALEMPSDGRKIMFSERSGEPFDCENRSSDICAVIGPKGGWDDSELQNAGSAGYEIVTLGGRILRAETAAIAITAILQHRFGDLN
jgi:16S rRNA (uracil1498-N3)-methyltransferase